MNTRWKKSGARLLVCASLLGCIALIGLYHPSGRIMEQPAEMVDANGLTADGYYTGPIHRISADDMKKNQHPAVVDWCDSVPILQKKVTLKLANANLSSAITALAKMTGLNFACVESGTQGKLSLQMHDVEVWQVMQALADSCGGSWQHDHDLFTLRLKNVAEAPVPAKFVVRAAVAA
jgi:hypothetical protein